MPEWLQWGIYLAGGTIALQGLIVTGWALFRDRAAGRRRCSKCWYDMGGTPPAADGSFICPECGKRIRSERGLRRTRRRYRRALFGLLMIAIGVAAIEQERIRRINPWSYVPTYAIIALAPYAADLPQRYTWEFDSRVFTYDIENGFSGRRPLHIVRPLTARQSRVLGRVAFHIVRDQPGHPLRNQLIGCLGISGSDHDTVQALLLVLIQDTDENTRECAASSLLELGADPSVALQALMLALSTYPSTSGTSGSPDAWRTYVVRIIGSFGPSAKPAVNELIRELSQVSLMRSGLGFGSDFWRRAAVLQALGRIGPDAAAVLPRLHATDEELESYRGDDYEERVAELLIGGACRTEDEARAALFAHPIWRVRRTAVFGPMFEKKLDPKWIPHLLHALADESSLVRPEAATMLLRNKVERDAAYRSLLRLNDADQSDAWTRVQIMWQYELDPKPVLPQLEAELAALDNPVVKDNIGRMIELVKSGVRPKNGNF